MSRKTIGLTVILVGAVALAIAGWLHLRHSRLYPATEDAYVGGAVLPVSSRIPGTVIEVLMSENEQVAAGQLLVRLDPRDLAAAAARARAQLARALATTRQDSAQIAGAEAQVAVASSQAEMARSDRDRYAALAGRGSAPQRQYEQARSAAAVAEAQLAAARKALAAARARLGVDLQEVGRYQAELEQAELQLSYVTILSPADGMVADKSVEPGQVVGPGQPLCRIVPLHGGELWVDANFKETQLQRIRPGQPAEIEVDAIPGHVFHGTVTALSAGTGAAFALLPPENASGNWVKIVQRLPVRIRLADGDSLADRLRLGLSAKVTVDTQAARPGEALPGARAGVRP